jgi:hypothetical protein
MIGNLIVLFSNPICTPTPNENQFKAIIRQCVINRNASVNYNYWFVDDASAGYSHLTVDGSIPLLVTDSAQSFLALSTTMSLDQPAIIFHPQFLLRKYELNVKSFVQLFRLSFNCFSYLL